MTRPTLIGIFSLTIVASTAQGQVDDSRWRRLNAMLTAEGEETIGSSSLLRTLAPFREIAHEIFKEDGSFDYGLVRGRLHDHGLLDRVIAHKGSIAPLPSADLTRQTEEFLDLLESARVALWVLEIDAARALRERRYDEYLATSAAMVTVLDVCASGMWIAGAEKVLLFTTDRMSQLRVAAQRSGSDQLPDPVLLRLIEQVGELADASRERTALAGALRWAMVHEEGIGADELEMTVKPLVDAPLPEVKGASFGLPELLLYDRWRHMEIRATQVVLYLELFRRRTGHYPEELEDLVDAGFPLICADEPVAREPFIYYSLGDGDAYALCSRWTDGQDDDGRYVTDLDPTGQSAVEIIEQRGDYPIVSRVAPYPIVSRVAP